MKILNTQYKNNDSNEWIVLVHGFGGSKGMWKKQVAAFQNSYNIIVIELPGHGESNDGIAKRGAVDFTDIAQAIIDMLHGEGITSAHFICVSLGTLMLPAILEICPDIVDSIIMSGAVCGMGGLSKLEFRLGSFLKHVMPYMAIVKLFAMILMPKKSHKLSRMYLIQECMHLGRAEFNKWYQLSDRELNRLHDNIKLCCTKPSLVIMGSEDHVFLSGVVETLKDVKDKVKLTIIENCGHVCSLQKWREFNRISAEFLGS